MQIKCTYSVVNDFNPANASCAILEILLFDKSMRRSLLKFENAFGVISVIKFCSKRLQIHIFIMNYNRLLLFSYIFIVKLYSVFLSIDATYISVVSSGSSDGTLVKLFSRQSTIPSAHRHGCGQLLVPPHSSGAFSVKPINRYQSIDIVVKIFEYIRCRIINRNSNFNNDSIV